MKKFFSEFKKFITRGNVLDLAVGVIIGSAFTAIVNALSNNILKPIINWLLSLVLGADSLSDIYTYLKTVKVDGVIDLNASIYIDWGAFINAIINFFLIALVLFVIVKTINTVNENYNKVSSDYKRLTKADKKELKKRGIKIFDAKAVQAYIAEKIQAEEAAKPVEQPKPTVEELLKDIKDILSKKAEETTEKTTN